MTSAIVYLLYTWYSCLGTVNISFLATNKQNCQIFSRLKRWMLADAFVQFPNRTVVTVVMWWECRVSFPDAVVMLMHKQSNHCTVCFAGDTTTEGRTRSRY